MVNLTRIRVNLHVGFRRLGYVRGGLHRRRTKCRVREIRAPVGVNRAEVYALSIERTKPTVKHTKQH